MGVSTHAVSVTPVSYSFTPTASIGTFKTAYQDNASGNQLTDGKYGQTTTFKDAADAEPWLGWLAPSSGLIGGQDAAIAQFAVDIYFEFDQAYIFDSVTVNVLQDHTANMVIPDFTFFSSMDGRTWDQVGQILTDTSALNNYQTRGLTLDGLNLNAQYLQVRLTVADEGIDTKGRWIFTDEVTFAAVPEGGATLVLLGLGFLGLAGLKRKNH